MGAGICDKKFGNKGVPCVDYVSSLQKRACFAFGVFHRFSFQQHGPVRFPVRFFHSNVFSTTSPLRFPVRSGSFFGHFFLFSTTSPVRFSKKEFFFILLSPKTRKLAPSPCLATPAADIGPSTSRLREVPCTAKSVTPPRNSSHKPSTLGQPCQACSLTDGTLGGTRTPPLGQAWMAMPTYPCA